MSEVTDVSILPQWKGHPVPWVTRWTGQISRQAITVSLAPTDPPIIVARYESGYEDREPSGILWMREALNRAGEPEYSQVSTLRQRAAMRKRLCQVCGQKIPPGPIQWLVSRRQLVQRDDGPITISAPTCEGCIPLALNRCPHLKVADDVSIFRVLEFQIFGVYASVVGLDKNLTAQERAAGYLRYGDTYPFPNQAVIARQQVVQFTKYIQEQ